MISMAATSSQRDPIILTDTNVEHSRVIKEALNIIYYLRVDADEAHDRASLYLYVIEFAKKWEVSMITDFIGREISRCIEGGKKQWQSFNFLLLALRLGDNSLAAKCCNKMGEAEWIPVEPKITQKDETNQERYPTEKWEFEERHGLPIPYLNDRPVHQLTKNNPLAATPGGSCIDLRVIPYDSFLQLPPTVAWIILHASIGHEPGSGSIENKVKQLLDLACESASTSPMVDGS